MKIAFLNCDHVNEDLRHIQGDYLDMFEELLPRAKFQVFGVSQGHFPEGAGGFDVYLVNGSRRSVYDDVDWIHELKRFVREIQAAGKKFLGVCFGHQLLAEALGGKVAKSANGWCVGVQEFNVLSKEKWMKPPLENLNLLMMCQDQVQVLPPGGVVLAKTGTCPIAMFRVGQQMLGIQGHPEFSKAYDRALMAARIDRMGEETVRQGLVSLEKPVDLEIIQSWLEHFFKLE